MDQIGAMRVFMRVAELASFTQTADTMGLPRATISSAVQQLEKQVGTRLLQRTTRTVRPTQDGRAFYERCKDLLADIEELQTMFVRAPSQLSGRLRVDMSSGIARTIVVPRLPEFLRMHPMLEMELSSTDRRVDLIREGFDCVVRVGAIEDHGLIARSLGEFTMVNCISPGYRRSHGVPRDLGDLARHRLIQYVSTLGARSPGFEYVDAASGETRYISMSSSITVNSSDAYYAACLAGLGIVQGPLIGVRDYLDRGALLEVLPRHRPPAMPVSLLYAHRRHLPKRVQAFMDWLADVMRSHLKDMTPAARAARSARAAARREAYPPGV